MMVKPENPAQAEERGLALLVALAVEGRMGRWVAESEARVGYLETRGTAQWDGGAWAVAIKLHEAQVEMAVDAEELSGNLASVAEHNCNRRTRG
jgi:hypothetical protein